ncbi:MAG: hypothetical protein EPN74_10705 [Rhodanobacter sp.]|nr:MAG: hypothetical protein EPN74_10705 [Rhodanobacter sp.]
MSSVWDEREASSLSCDGVSRAGPTKTSPPLLLVRELVLLLLLALELPSRLPVRIPVAETVPMPARQMMQPVSQTLECMVCAPDLKAKYRIVAE